jgi:hypothetical protein
MKDLRASNAYIMDRLFKKGFEGAQHELNWKPLLSTYRQIANRRCDRLENYASSIRASWNYSSFFHHWRFPLQLKIVWDEGRTGREEGTERGWQDFPIITLYDEEIRLTMGLSMPTSDKGLDKASYELGTLHTVPMVWRTLYFHQFQEERVFWNTERDWLYWTNERSVICSLQQATSQQGFTTDQSCDNLEVEY